MSTLRKQSHVNWYRGKVQRVTRAYDRVSGFGFFKPDMEEEEVIW